MLKAVAFTAAATLASAALAPIALADGHTLHNERIKIVFGSSINGYTTTDADRVDSITWINSAKAALTNYVAEAVPGCNDPLEFFGQAYGNGFNAQPYAVVQGVASKWAGTAVHKGTTHITALNACANTLDAKTTTIYGLSSKPDLINALAIRRIFTFAAAPHSGDLRAYVARTPVATYPNVLYLTPASLLQTIPAINCGGNCSLSYWNGKWMAKDNGAGTGIVMIRPKSDTLPAYLTINYDANSASNAAAITLTQPSGGWSGKVVETEYLCFYDKTSWPPAARLAGKLPKGCTGVPQ